MVSGLICRGMYRNVGIAFVESVVGLICGNGDVSGGIFFAG